MNLHELLAELAKMEFDGGTRHTLFERALEEITQTTCQEDIKTEKDWAEWNPDYVEVCDILQWPTMLDSTVLQEIAELALDVAYQLKFRAQRPKKH